jgi:MHS family proline/betaine transporter-like MFS transporter
LLVALRLFQGLAVAGEAATSVTFLIEQALPERRALTGSLGTATAVMGMLIGSGVGALITSLLDETELQNWGWRIPFLAGIAISAIAMYLRRSLPEEQVKQDVAKAPLREAFATRWRTMLVLLGLNAVGPVGFYLCLIFAATYLHRTEHLAASTVLGINTIAALVQLLATPLAAAISDRVGRRPVLFFGAGGLLVLAWPLFWVMHHPNPAFALSGQIVLTILVAIFTGTAPTMMAELLPHRIRCTALSFSFNVGFGVIGGLTPLAALYLMRLDQNALSPAYLLMAAAAVSILVLAFLPETSKRLMSGRHDSAIVQSSDFRFSRRHGL